MIALFVCPGCNRHLRRTESVCPFCATDVKEAFARAKPRPLPPHRMSRSALAAFAAASVVGAGCGGEAKTHDIGSGNAGNGTGATGSNGTGGIAGAEATGGMAGAAGTEATGGFPVEATGGYISMVFYGAPMFWTGGAPAISTGGSPNASGGSPGTDPNVADGGLNCRDEFSGGTPSRCCAKTPPDCTNKPDGYPGFGCTPGPQSFCSCTCNSGMWTCGC